MASEQVNGTKRRHDASAEKPSEKREFPKRPRLEEKTDLMKWRMRDDEGRLTWHYLQDDEAAKDWPQSYADKWYLGLPMVSLAFLSLALPPLKMILWHILAPEL